MVVHADSPFYRWEIETKDVTLSTYPDIDGRQHLNFYLTLKPYHIDLQDNEMGIFTFSR